MAVERVTTREAEYQNLVSDLVTPLLALEAHATPIREGKGQVKRKKSKKRSLTSDDLVSRFIATSQQRKTGQNNFFS